MQSPPPLVFQTDFDAQPGRPVAVGPHLLRLTAPNASPYTFTGTNSFLVGETTLAVIDPGPDEAGHLAALLAAIAGRRVEAILITHTHTDHSALARKLGSATGAPLWFGGPHRLSRPRRPFEINAVGQSSDWSLRPDRVLADGERLVVGGVDIAVVATPGHCANHLAFGLPGMDMLLSGDHVMGWSSTLVSVPDGSMRDYLASLDRVIALPYRRYLPAHGGPIADGPLYAQALLAHRQMRNRQVIAAVEAGARSIGALRRRIYAGLKPSLAAAARMTLGAHVDYLAETGAIDARWTPLGWRLAPAGGR